MEDGRRDNYLEKRRSLKDAIASKLAPTGLWSEPHLLELAQTTVGASLLAMTIERATQKHLHRPRFLEEAQRIDVAGPEAGTQAELGVTDDSSNR
ncbi:hypothetical protein [Pseudomonas sp. ZB1P45]|uniref:hypothetical protein n=1 Tax=Pseudomonas frigoris TaxID=3398356 RepID=UPI0039F0C71C